MRDITWDDLVGENAGVVMATITDLMDQMKRGLAGAEEFETLKKDVRREWNERKNEYRERAMSGDYENLLRVSHEYALRYFKETLRVPEEFVYDVGISTSPFHEGGPNE